MPGIKFPKKNLYEIAILPIPLSLVYLSFLVKVWVCVMWRQASGQRPVCCSVPGHSILSLLSALRRWGALQLQAAYWTGHFVKTSLRIQRRKRSWPVLKYSAGACVGRKCRQPRRTQECRVPTEISSSMNRDFSLHVLCVSTNWHISVVDSLMVTSKSEHVTWDYSGTISLTRTPRNRTFTYINEKRNCVESYAGPYTVGKMPLRKLLANTSNHHFNYN